jgi:carbonic anhydrase
MTALHVFKLMLALLLTAGTAAVRAAEPAPAPPREPAASAPAAARVEGTRVDLESQLREAMKSGDPTKKRLNLIIDPKSSNAGMAQGSPAPVNPVDSRSQEAPPAPAVLGQRPREGGLVIRPQRPAAPREVPRNIPWGYTG